MAHSIALRSIATDGLCIPLSGITYFFDMMHLRLIISLQKWIILAYQNVA